MALRTKILRCSELCDQGVSEKARFSIGWLSSSRASFLGQVVDLVPVVHPNPHPWIGIHCTINSYDFCVKGLSEKAKCCQWLFSSVTELLWIGNAKLAYMAWLTSMTFVTKVEWKKYWLAFGIHCVVNGFDFCVKALWEKQNLLGRNWKGKIFHSFISQKRYKYMYAGCNQLLCKQNKYSLRQK